jgi:hypothetical protein
MSYLIHAAPLIPQTSMMAGLLRPRPRAVKLVLRSVQMIQRGNLLFRHPAEGRDLFVPWAPAFAGVTRCLCQR